MATCEWKSLILNRIIALRRFTEPFHNLSNHFKNAACFSSSASLTCPMCTLAPTLDWAIHYCQLVFINTSPGAMLPDLMQLVFLPVPGQELRMVTFRAQANGTLRAAFGVPDGTASCGCS